MQEMHRPFLPFSTNFKILNFFLSSNITNNIFQLVTLLNRFHIFFSLFSSFPVYYPFSDRGSFRPAFNNPSPACLNNGKAPVCGLVYGRFAEHASHTSTERDVRYGLFILQVRSPLPLKTQSCGQGRSSQSVEEPGLYSGADWVSNIYERKNSKTKRGQQIPPFPCGQFFQVHGNKLKLHPVRHLGQASVLRITHRVFFLGVCEDPLNGFLSALIELRVRRRISGIVRQFLIVLPDMPLHRFDTVSGMRTPFSGRTGGADIRITLVFPISITVRCAIFQGLVFGTYHAVVEFIIDILPPLVSILHGLRALVGCGKDSAIAEHFLADMRRFVWVEP